MHGSVDNRVVVAGVGILCADTVYILPGANTSVGLWRDSKFVARMSMQRSLNSIVHYHEYVVGLY